MNITKKASTPVKSEISKFPSETKKVILPETIARMKISTAENPISNSEINL
jgi:hypothetical protein